MKGKNIPQDIFDTRCWLNEVITDPYQVIAEIFSCTTCSQLCDVAGQLVQYAISPEIYSARAPCDVILYMRMVSSAIRATCDLKDKDCNVLVVDEDGVFNQKHDYRHAQSRSAWPGFPRFLSKKEYDDPCQVFEQFLNYQSLEDWLTVWRNIVDGALCPEESRFFINEILVYTNLLKCMEAVHLIHVRETVPNKSRLKSWLLENY